MAESLQRHNYRDVLTWWEYTGQNTETGGYNFNAPVEVKGHWEQHTKNMHEGTHRAQVSQSVAFVDRIMHEQDYLALGSHSESDPTQVPAAFQIREFTRMTSISSLHVQYKAYL